TATITLTVSDGTDSATSAFTLTVSSVNDLPTISSVTDRTIPGNTGTGAISFSVGDIETAAGSLTVTAVASNTTLIPAAGLALGGTGASRTLTITPAANQSGTSTITLTVNDGADAVSTTFTLTVTPANTPPTISPVNARTVS